MDLLVHACRNPIYALRFDFLYFCDETRWPPYDGSNIGGVSLHFYYYLRWDPLFDLVKDKVLSHGRTCFGDTAGVLIWEQGPMGPTCQPTPLLVITILSRNEDLCVGCDLGVYLGREV